MIPTIAFVSSVNHESRRVSKFELPQNFSTSFPLDLNVMLLKMVVMMTTKRVKIIIMRTEKAVKRTWKKRMMMMMKMLS